MSNPRDDDYFDQDEPPKRHPRGCWCRLDGYPGTCPGPQHCPYSGFHDHDEDENDDAE